jgi:hypothetical protein
VIGALNTGGGKSQHQKKEVITYGCIKEKQLVERVKIGVIKDGKNHTTHLIRALKTCFTKFIT